MNTRIFRLIAAAALLGGAGANGVAQKKPAAAPAAADWTKTVAVTPEGGFRVGNPQARVKLVEYGSLTCPHCAEFVKEGVPPLLAHHVKSGKVSFEFRNMVLNGVDMTASLLARCAGPRNFFRVVDGMYLSQPQWVGKITAMTQAQKDAVMALPQADQMGRVAEIAGLTQLAASGGVTPQKAKQCLADKAAVQKLAQMHELAVKQGVTGTPAFLINDRKVEAHHWSELEPLIKQAGG